MPSASPLVRPRLYVRIAWETAGVGVYSSLVGDHDVTSVGGQHLHRTGTGREKGVGVHAEEQRSVDPLLLR